MIEASTSFYGTNAVSDGMDTAMGNLSADGGLTSTQGQSINGWNNMFAAVATTGANAQSAGCTG